MVHSNLTRMSYRDGRAGRVGECVAASALLALTLPLTMIVAIAIKCESTGPVFVRQQRTGAAGRHYVALKFRTARRQFAQGPYENAYHTTGVGWLLRYTRIENLPQLVNVLRGEMSCLSSRSGRPFFLD